MRWPWLAAMDHHAWYVWASYLLTLAVIAGEVLLLRRRRRALRHDPDGGSSPVTKRERR